MSRKATLLAEEFGQVGATVTRPTWSVACGTVSRSRVGGQGKDPGYSQDAQKEIQAIGERILGGEAEMILERCGHSYTRRSTALTVLSCNTDY